MAQHGELPHWDLSVVFPGVETPEFEEGFQAAVQSIADLGSLFDRHKVSGEGGELAVDDDLVTAVEEVLTSYNRVAEQVHTLVAYLRGWIATDSRYAPAQARWSELLPHIMRLDVLETRMIAWLGRLDVDGLIARSDVAREHAFALRRARIRARHLMSPVEEELAAELSMTGGIAWAKLYDDYTSQLVVPVEVRGELRQLPMSATRNLAFDPDRSVRQNAYRAELKAWEQHALPIAAAMNSIKGEVLALTRRRGWDSPLDLALFDNRIDRETLDAMMGAAWDAFPDFRRYLRAKARLLGLDALCWYDLFAPVTGEGRTWSFSEAREFIVAQFGRYDRRLQEMAERAFRERWIDAEPRPGKVDGGFCMWLRGDESRILVNYQPAFGHVGILAHELGHAYHNLNLAHRTVLQRDMPMTLAETASIFCQTLVREAALEGASEQEQLVILENALQDACQVVVDITSRFLFERDLFERRRTRELSAAELCELMLDAQRQTYGDGLDDEALHPYMWAVKPHYYSHSYSFYNFPYMFGLLFGLGLYARYKEAPEQFKASYDDLLSSTGMGDAADLAARFGMDIRSPSFWSSSLDVIRADIDRFEALVARRPAAGGADR